VPVLDDLAAVAAAVADASVMTLVVTALLSSGGAVFLSSVVKSWATLRGGARARERETITDLAARADDAERRERVARRDLDYWRDIAAKYRYQLREKGITPNPEDPVQPSDQPPPATSTKGRSQ
jgi:hypothetical protein